MKTAWAILVCVLALGAAPAAQAAPAFAGKVAAVECRSRGGVGHVMAKIRAGENVRVAYFGGSITEMDGWRRLSREWLAATYPNASFTEIGAAIGGTGSKLGCFRFAQDVLDKNPDLVFVEFATNDAGLPPAEVWRNFDGFIRQAWRRNPAIDFVFVYTITKPMMSDYGQGLATETASAMEQLADYYEIPSVGFGPRVAKDVLAGTLVMSMGEVETAVPENTPDRDAAIDAELAAKGQMLFSKDGVHPALPGHTRYYLESIKAAWPQIAAVDGLPDHAAKLAAPFSEATMEAAKLVTVTPKMLSGAWRQLEATDENGNFNARFGAKAWFTETPGAKLRFRFRGTGAMIYDLMGPACGQVWVIVDGVRRPAPVSRFDKYCTYYRTIALDVFSGTEGVHEVELVLDDRPPDRTSVMASGVTAGELAGPKYTGTRWYAGRLMLVGDLVAEPKTAWFDARIDRVADWPRDAMRAVKGTWRAASLSEQAGLAEPGVLEIASDGAAFDFVADDAADFANGVKAAVVTSRMSFVPYAAENLPPVPENAKAAVILVDDGASLGYQALVAQGERLVWTRLEGVTPTAPGTTVELSMTFRMVEGRPTVAYAFDGVTAQAGGQTALSIQAATPIDTVSFSGFSQLRALIGSLERCTGMTVNLL